MLWILTLCYVGSLWLVEGTSCIKSEFRSTRGHGEAYLYQVLHQTQEVVLDDQMARCSFAQTCCLISSTVDKDDSTISIFVPECKRRCRDTAEASKKQSVAKADGSSGDGENSLIGELDRAFADTPHANPLLSQAQLRALRRRNAAAHEHGCVL